MNIGGWIPGLVAAAGVIAGGVDSAGAESSRPNVLVILIDDQGSVDAGCYGATDLRTPAIDALAERGVRFTQSYAAAPVCSPSRAGLLTGRYPVRAGVPGNISSQPGHAGMPTEQVTLAEVFRDAGYATAHIGKWHLGYSPETMPNAQGFAHSFGHMGGCIDNYSHFFYWDGPNRHDLWRNGEEVREPGRFFGDLMVEEATAFIEENRGGAWLIYWAINMPHYPYQGDVEWLGYYDQVPYPRNLYNAFVSTLDARIGRVLDRIDELGLREDTIVVFQSDHGHSVEVRAHGGGGSSGPYRGAKFSLFEGGVRVPAIISWPGHLPEGEVRKQAVIACDWLPTVADLCGIDLGGLDLDGRSLVPVIEESDAPSPHDVMHWGTDRHWAVRRGDWKLLGHPVDPTMRGEFGDEDQFYLVDLANDVSERTNLAQEHPEIVADLRRLHEEWVESW